MSDTSIDASEATPEKLYLVSESLRYLSARSVLITDGLYWALALVVSGAMSKAALSEEYINNVQQIAYVLAVAIPLGAFAVTVWIESRLRMSVIRSQVVMLRLRNQFLLCTFVVPFAGPNVKDWSADKGDYLWALFWPLFTGTIVAWVLVYIGGWIDTKLLPPFGEPGIKPKPDGAIPTSSLRTRILNRNQERPQSAT